MTAFLSWVEHHPGLASWIQAVGSIAAIVAAVLIASRQARADLRLRRAELADRLGAVETMLVTCRDTIADFQAEIARLPDVKGRKFPHQKTLNAVRVAINVVSAIAPVQAPTPVAAKALISAQTAITNSVGFIPNPQANAEFHVGWEREVKLLSDAIAEAADDLVHEVKRVQRG